MLSIYLCKLIRHFFYRLTLSFATCMESIRADVVTLPNGFDAAFIMQQPENLYRLTRRWVDECFAIRRREDLSRCR